MWFICCRFYSVKKKQHSINILAIVSLDGKILWLSKSYPGCYNDKEIIKVEWRNIRHFFQNEEGFGNDGLSGLHPQIPILPPYLKGMPFYKTHSSKRIVIEQVFSFIKRWHACKHQMYGRILSEKKILDAHNKRWTVCAYLVNKHVSVWKPKNTSPQLISADDS